MFSTGTSPQQSVVSLSKWDEIKGIVAPFKNQTSRDFGYWFNYFWAECVKLANPDQKQKRTMLDIFFNIFGGTAPNFEVRSGFKVATNETKRKMLSELLDIGFQRVRMRPPGVMEHHSSGGSLARPPLNVMDASALNLNMVTASGGDIPIAFRADARDYAELNNHKGFLTRARSPNSPVYANNALDQPWHPYNSKENANCLFLRLGEVNKDNCLHTVISVGGKFAAITHFPILSDGTVFTVKDEHGWPLASKPIDSWTNTNIADALNSNHKIRTVNDGNGVPDLLEKDVYLYVLNLKGLKGVNTQAQFPGEDSFPERGMEKVPLENILAEIRFTQKYFFKDEDGKIALYALDFSPIRWVPTESAVTNILGDGGKNQVIAIVNDEVNKAKRRDDITFESGRRDRQNQDKAANRLLTADERNQVLAKLREIGPGNAPITTAKKNEVMNALPALKPKLRSANWAWLRDRAMLPG